MTRYIILKNTQGQKTMDDQGTG